LVLSSPNELWQSWGQPEIWRLPHGHISTAVTASMPGLPGRVLRWLSPRLNNPTIRMQNKKAISTSDKLRLAPINK
jgi:hypothetical protein